LRKEQEVAFKYRKDTNEERFLFKLNNILAPHQEKDYQELKETYPTLYIIGVPRSGTTLLSQLIASHLNIGYINNLIACFWKAPIYGIRLSKKLLKKDNPSYYISEFGRTKYIHESHEFGYFWSSLLDYNEMIQKNKFQENNIDWQKVKLILTNIIHEFDSPVFFKYPPIGWHIKKMQEILKKSCFVRVARNPIQNAISILNTRIKFLGSVNRWFSMKPLEYKKLKNEKFFAQIAGQIYYIDKAISNQITKSGCRNVLNINYEDLCQSPKEILDKIKKMLERNGANIKYKSLPPKSFNIKSYNVSSNEDYIKIAKSLKEFYNQEISLEEY